MIESTEVGQHQVDILLENLDCHDWTDWERDFIESLQEKDYETLSSKQCRIITDLYEKL